MKSVQSSCRQEADISWDFLSLMHNRASRWWGQKGQYCAKITNVCVSPKWDGSLDREGLFRDSAHMLFIVCFVAEFYTYTILCYTIVFGWIQLALSWNCEPITKLLIIYISSKYKSRYNYSSFSICLWGVYLACILSATSTFLVLPYFKLWFCIYLFYQQELPGARNKYMKTC